MDTGKDEEQYDAYINREGFNGLTLAPIIGNHDERGNAHEEHFKVSNVQDEGKSNAGSNYYYVYNNTLFICLNSNNKDLSLIHISEPTRPSHISRMPSSA